ncbi:MAG: lysophospholipid acyltransferase family protein [Oceanipulchritudo sp.]
MSHTANPSGKIHEVSRSARLATTLLSRTVRAWQDTLEYTNTEEIRRLMYGDEPGSLVLLWHNRLFPCIGAMMNSGKANRRLHALVSASRDGALLSEFLRAQGILPVRGSSSRRGAVATRELFRILAAGDHVAITVDGPRGPRYRAQPGAALLVQRSGAPLYFLGAECESCWELDSWDRFLVPRPFSRVRIRMERFRHVPQGDGREERHRIRELLENHLRALTADGHLDPCVPGGT